MLSEILNLPEIRNPIASTCQNTLVPWCKDAFNTYCQNKLNEQVQTVNFYALLVSLLFFITAIGIITLLEQFGYFTENSSAIVFVVCLIITMVLYFVLK
jgi:hypothetical protein